MRRLRTWVPPSKRPLPPDTVNCDTCGREIPYDGEPPEMIDCEFCIRERWEEAIDYGE